MAKMTVAQIYRACGEATRLQLNHPNDDVGKRALNASRTFTTFLGHCQTEIEIPSDVEEAIRVIS